MSVSSDQLLSASKQGWANFPISHGYITQYQGPGTDTPHYAVDVATPFHTPITSLVSGKVKQADFKDWGGEVFVQPDTGGPQIYEYHLDTLNVRPGQHVSQGQLLGLSGGQNQGGQHPTSPQWSTGPHTHVGYFSKYITTPAGGRPYGPDITSLLKSGAGALQPLTTPVTDTAASSTNWYCNIPVLGGYLCPETGLTGQDFLYRVTFGLIGGLLIWIGLKHFLGGTKIDINLPEVGEDKTKDYQASVAKERADQEQAEKKATKERERKSGYDLSKERKAPPPAPGMKRGKK